MANLFIYTKSFLMKKIFAGSSLLLLLTVLGASTTAAQTSGEVMCGWSVIPGPFSVGDTMTLDFQAGALSNQSTTLTVNFYLSSNPAATGGFYLGSGTVFIERPGNFCSANEEKQVVLNHPAINGCLAPGTWYIIFTVGEDAVSAAITVQTPTITSFSPTSGFEGTIVTISGVGFFGAQSVQFDGINAAFVVDSDTSIRAAVPAGAGTAEIRVAKSCLQFSSGANFTIVPAPVIYDFTPKVGLIGSEMTVTGSHFTGLTGVSFNGAPVVSASFNDTTIIAVVPPGATDGPISVTTVTPAATAVSAVDFMIDPYCASTYMFGDASRIGSLRFGNLEYVNDSVPGCAVYTNNIDRVAHVFPGQTGLSIEILQDSCDGLSFDKATKLFIDWNIDDDFDDIGEEVLSGPVETNPLLYVDTFDVPMSATLGKTRMRVVTAEAASPSLVLACGAYDGGENQDYTLEISACAGTRDLPPTLWHMISLPCDPGLANTVQDIFGDDLTGIYGSRWGLFAYDVVTGQSSLMNLTDPVEPRVGYWLKTLDTGQSIGLAGVNPLAVGVHGQQNTGVDIPLVAAPEGRSNLVGFPYTFKVGWPDVLVVDGSSVLTLEQADPVVGQVRACEMDPPHASCVMSQKFYRWNGGGYDSFNGGTPGVEGLLTPLDGLWVKAFKSGIALRIPEVPLSRVAQSAGRTEHLDGWFMRLIAESGDLRDGGNVLGELAESRDGYDLHDLDERPPFGEPYLTIVFPHPDWAEWAGDYTTDFRALNLDSEAEPNRWQLEVRSSDPTAPVTLSWQGPDFRLLDAELLDEETGELVALKPGGTYSFFMTGPSRRFQWSVRGGALPPSALVFTDGFESGTTNAWAGGFGSKGR